MKLIKYLVALIILISSHGILSAKSLYFDGGINPEIWRVVSGGLWQNDTSYGNYRVVVQNIGWEHTRSYLFLQWIKNDDEKQLAVEFKTIPISEFNDNVWYNIQDMQYTNDAFIITYIIRGEENKIRKAVLKPNLPGKYIFIKNKKS